MIFDPKMLILSPTVILLCVVQLINGQFYFAFEVPDDSRIPQSNLFDVNSFKYIPPSQLSRSFAASLPRAASTPPQEQPSMPPTERRQSRARNIESSPSSSGLQSSAQNNVFLRSPVPSNQQFGSPFASQPQPQPQGQPQLFQVPPDPRFRLSSTADQLQPQQIQPQSQAPTFSSVITQPQQPSVQRFPTSLGQQFQQPQQVFTSEGPDFKHTLTTNFAPSPSQPPPQPLPDTDLQSLRSPQPRQPQIISQGAPADQTFSPGPPPFTEQPSAGIQQPPKPGPFESFFRQQAPTQPQFQQQPPPQPQFQSQPQFLPPQTQPQPQMLPRTPPPQFSQPAQPQFSSPQPQQPQLSQPQQPQQTSQGLTQAQIAALNFFNGAPNPRAFEHVRARFEAQQRAQLEAQTRAQGAARAQEDERARAEAQARANAEARTKLEAQIRAQHEAQARANAEAQARAHEVARQRAAQEAAQRAAQQANQPSTQSFNSRQQQPIQTLPRTQFQSSPDLSNQQFQPQPLPQPPQQQFQQPQFQQPQFQQPQQPQFQQPQQQPQPQEQFSGFDQFGQPIGGGDILRNSGRSQQAQSQRTQQSQPQTFSSQPSFQSAPSQPTFQTQPQPSFRQNSALSFNDQRSATGSQIEQPRPQATTSRPPLSNPSTNARSAQAQQQPSASSANQPNWAPAKLAIAQLPADTDDDGIPGLAGKDYPTLMAIPETSFSCKRQPLSGYYADTETACQVVHFCQTGGVQDSFLCPNGTIFNQEKFSCQWWYEVNCADAPRFYVLNDNLYRVPSQTSPTSGSPSSSPSSSSSASSGSSSRSSSTGKK